MKKTFLLNLVLIMLIVLTTIDTEAKIYTSMDDYLVAAEVMPEPIGGLSAVYKNVVYPSSAKTSGTQGKVFLMIMVNETGSVDEVKIIKGIGNGCDEAAVEGVKKAKFTPGKIKGANVKVKLALAIEFKL